MKKVLLGLMTLACVSTFAQKIKIKKDKINIDETEVGILDKQKQVYKILSLDNRPIFSIERKMASLLDGSTVYWSVLTDLNTNKTNEVFDYGENQGLSFERTIIASVCNDKYKFISSAGIDEKGVTEFINGTPTDVEKVFAEANLKTKNLLKAEYDAMVAKNIKVENGTIYQKQEVYKDGKPVMDYVVIGSVSKENITFMPNFPPSLVYNVTSIYYLKNNKGKDERYTKLLGGWYATKTGYSNPTTKKNIKNEIITWDNKYYNLRGSISGAEKVSDAGLEKDDLNIFGSENYLPVRVVARLLYNGYTFEAMK